MNGFDHPDDDFDAPPYAYGSTPSKRECFASGCRQPATRLFGFDSDLYGHKQPVEVWRLYTCHEHGALAEVQGRAVSKFWKELLGPELDRLEYQFSRSSTRR